MMERVFLVAALLAPLLLAGALAQERDAAAEFKAAKGSLTQQLRDKKKENRLAAVGKIETFTTPEAAKLLLFQGLSNNEEEVRRASFDALAKLSGDKEVCGFLKTTIVKQWKGGKPQPETFAGLAILLASELEDIRADARQLVKDAAERRTHGRVILISLADELAHLRGDNVCHALMQLIDLSLFQNDFAFRRAVEQAIVQVRSKDGVTELIKLLAKVKGEVRTDIVNFLSEISGREPSFDPVEWDQWWSEVKARFEFPPEKKEVAAGRHGPGGRPAAKVAAGPSYYGLPLSGAKIVFVIDTSGSMAGPRIFAAKRELSKAVEELPADVEFNIISFNVRNYPWQLKLMPASAENKQNAIYFIAAQGLGNATASYDALDAALEFDAEAVYFLTDGAPHGGRITNPPAIVKAITQANTYRRMTINSIGIGVGVSGNPFDTFLSTLAEHNYGEYKRVDQ